MPEVKMRFVEFANRPLRGSHQGSSIREMNAPLSLANVVMPSIYNVSLHGSIHHEIHVPCVEENGNLDNRVINEGLTPTKK